MVEDTGCRSLISCNQRLSYVVLEELGGSKESLETDAGEAKVAPELIQLDHMEE